MPLNKYSKNVTQDPTQPAAQAMLHAIGMNDSDFEKPLIGVASTGYEGILVICTLTNYLPMLRMGLPLMIWLD